MATVTKINEPPAVDFWRATVYDPVVALLSTIARKRAMAEFGKTPPPIREDIERIRAFVPCGVYADYDRQLYGVLGVAEHTETRELFAVVLRRYVKPALIPILDFLRPLNSAKGLENRLGVNYRPIRLTAPAELLTFCWRGAAGPEPGFASLWKDPTNRYAVHGEVSVVGATGFERETGMLYTPLYAPHTGSLVVRPCQTPDMSAGFFDRIEERQTRSGELYSGMRFLFDEAPVSRESTFAHISVCR